MLIGFIIWELVSLIFVAIALWCRRSEKPVGFWSNVRFEADRIGDVSAYNRAVSKLWLGFALVLAVLGLPNAPGKFCSDFIVSCGSDVIGDCDNGDLHEY